MIVINICSKHEDGLQQINNMQARVDAILMMDFLGVSHLSVSVSIIPGLTELTCSRVTCPEFAKSVFAVGTYI